MKIEKVSRDNLLAKFEKDYHRLRKSAEDIDVIGINVYGKKRVQVTTRSFLRLFDDFNIKYRGDGDYPIEITYTRHGTKYLTILTHQEFTGLLKTDSITYAEYRKYEEALEDESCSESIIRSGVC